MNGANAGKTIIVTGGAQGIGKAIALKFLTESCSVVLVDIDEQAGNETLEEFEKIGKVEFVCADVSKEHDVKKVIDQTVKVFGGLNVLINNAGISSFYKLSDISLEDWHRVIGINLTAPFLFARYAASYLTQRKGSIINIASTRALMSEPDNEAYAASKGGLLSLTHALANSLGPAVRVNAISPGWIDVSEWKRSDKRKKEDHSDDDHAQHPVGRVGIPDDVADLAFYLASEHAAFITGQNFVVDGGMTKKMIYV